MREWGRGWHLVGRRRQRNSSALLKIDPEPIFGNGGRRHGRKIEVLLPSTPNDDGDADFETLWKWSVEVSLTTPELESCVDMRPNR